MDDKCRVRREGGDDFDAVVIAASVGLGGYQKYIRRFAHEHAGRLTSKPSAFVSVNGTSPETLPEWRAASKRYIEGFLQETSWRPRWTAGFTGALCYSKYGFATRMVMKYLSRRQGGPTDTSKDYEFTDWQAVDRFAAELATGLVPSQI